MHVVMTYPSTIALRGSDWAAAARRGGADVTEIVLNTNLGTPSLPTIPWLAQPATRRYVIELPTCRTERKRAKRLAERVLETFAIVAGHHGAVDLLHTHVAASAGFAATVSGKLGIPHVHSEPLPDAAAPETTLTPSLPLVLNNADAIRTWAGHPTDSALPDAYRDRLRAIATPIDFSIEGANPQFTRIDGNGAIASSGEPWLAAISPRKILWRGDLAGEAATQMVDAFASLRLTGTQLEMIGSGIDTSTVTELAAKLGLDGRITLRTTGTPREMAHLISQADLLVISDGDPRLEREAMTALVLGTPVVAPDSAVYRELITPAMGAIVADGESKTLVAAIRGATLVDVKDPILMAAAASRHSLAAVGAELHDLYYELVHGKTRPEAARSLMDVAEGGQIAI